MSSSLFETCAAAVLGSPYLLDRASLHLPHGISHFLLYLAAESGNHLAVKKLVAKWPHGDLTLDFVSESSLCRRHRCRGSHCLEPHEYVGVFGSYARYSSVEIVSSLLDGVFYNLHYYRGLEESQGVGLRHINMSAVVIRPEQLPLLVNLVNGTVPATHQSDYLSDREAEILGVSRPRLHDQSSSLTVEGQSLLTLLVNVLLDGTTTKQTVRTLNKVCSLRQWVEVKLKGVNLLGLKPAASRQLHSCVDVLLNSATDHMYLSDLSEWHKLATVAGNPSSLWLCGHSLHPIPVPLDCRDLLFVAPFSIDGLAMLSQLIFQPRGLRAFCLMLSSLLPVRDKVFGELCLFLERVAGTLEYLQLVHCSFTAAGLDSLHKCSRLRVLSISLSGTKYSLPLPDVLRVSSKLPHLEFFLWAQELSLATSDILCLDNLLNVGFNSLCHFHVKFPFILDLEGEGCVLMLSGVQGRLTEAKLLGWLCYLRPDVCFRLGPSVLEQSQLCNAVTMDGMFRV